MFSISRYLICTSQTHYLLMDLKMFLGNEPIDALKINADHLHKPGHIESLKLEMEEKNEDIIDLSSEEPKFFIETVPSSMNRNQSTLQLMNKPF